MRLWRQCRAARRAESCAIVEVEYVELARLEVESTFVSVAARRARGMRRTHTIPGCEL